MNSSSCGIAGVGAVCSAGADVATILSAFDRAQPKPTPPRPEAFIAAPTFPVVADLPQLPGRFNNSRSLRLAMKAVHEALADAKIGPIDAPLRVGICLGTTVASQLNSVEFYDVFRRQENPPLDAVHDFLHANLAQAVGKLLGVSGPRMTIVNACSSGTDAIGVASTWIRTGLCDLALAGGADEMNRVAMAGFWSLGVMSSKACTPFDRDRSGLNLGEGAGIVLLESAEHAQRRGKRHPFELAGFGAAADAHHLTAPHPDGRGLDQAIRTAMAQAGVEPSQLAFLNAHGTATADNDRAEGKVIARIFGSSLPFLSTKGYTGHTLGAAGGLEAVFTLLGLRENWIPPSAGFENQPEDIPAAPIRRRTNVSGDCAISTSLAFGGNNSAIVIRKVA